MKDLFAERLASLDLRRPGGGAEDPQALGLKGVDNAGHERSLGADHGEVNRAGPGQPHQPRDVPGLHRDVLADLCRSRIARGDEHLGAVGGQFPGQGMLATTATDNEDATRGACHWERSFRKWSWAEDGSGTAGFAAKARTAPEGSRLPEGSRDANRLSAPAKPALLGYD